MAQLRLCGCFYAASFYCFTLLSISAAHITDPSEVSALHAVKSSLSDPMKHLSNWKKGDPCTSNWTGVMCFDLIGADGYFHVQELQLLNMNLSGTLAPELGRLSHLKILDFMWNELSGSIPKERANISSLKLLLLSGNKLSGSLPSELGYLSNLTRLQVDENQISGPIPNFFSKLSSVKHLHLNNNSITGQIPSELSNLSTLLHLVLENNNLSGYLPPEFSNLPELSLLQLDNNNFNSSHIPASYENFSRLVKLSLRNCSLEGGVPDLSRIATLKYIDLSNNQLSGRIPSNVLSQNMTTIDLSDNHLNGSIPEHFSYLPSLQKLSLENNDLSGSVVASIWQNKNFSSAAKLLIDLQNNSLSNILGDLNPPENISLRLQGNPICRNANIEHIVQFCGSEVGWYDLPGNLTNSSVTCPIQACPVDNYFEYVPQSPEPCFCASPLRIGYRLKSPSFSYFPTYAHPFEAYLTKSLNLSIYQLSIDSFIWEKGPRLRMYLKLFPMAGVQHSNTFNSSEIIRIRGIFTSWEFPSSDLFGPYELLNFTLLGPYSYVNLETQGKGIGKGVLIAVVVAAVAFTLAISVILTILITRKHARRQHKLSRRHPSSTVPIKIDGVKCFKFQEMRLATDNFNSSTQVGQGGYGNVYRGILSDNTIVAIKRAKGGSLQGQKEFLTEIEMLSRLHHRNLVSLLGYCDEEGEQMLVYEFMPNGTLQYWLSATCRETLNFGVRFRIALGSAKGILYLHTEADPPIFHRDIKASNILLDSKHTAKVADFGLSRLAPVQDDEGSLPDHVSTIVKGTPGYLDPEYLLTSKLTDKSDVYSLGVVFMELLTGMQPISRGKNIVREVSLAHKSGRLLSLLDSRMGSCPCECVERFFSLALRCCQDSQEERPSMLDVVRELENILPMMPESASASSSLVNSGGDTDRPFISSSTLSGSDLISGVTPTISPR